MASVIIKIIRMKKLCEAHYIVSKYVPAAVAEPGLGVELLSMNLSEFKTCFESQGVLPAEML